MEIFRLFGTIFLKDDEVDKRLDAIDKKGEQTAGTFSKLTDAAGQLALGLAAAGAAVLLALGVKGFKSADELQKALNGVQAATGAVDTEMKGLKDSMLNIYEANLGQSFEDIGNSLTIVKQLTGESGKSLENMTKKALVLRDTFQFEVNESTRAASTLMKQFGIDGDKAYNIIAQAAQKGANKNGDLLDTFNEYSVQFKSLGFSAEQFANVLVDGAKNGAWSIDKVGDAVKEFNIRAKDGSKTSIDSFKSLGLEADKMTASFANGGSEAQKAFQQVVTALDGIKDPVEQNRIGVQLFGTQFEDLEAQGILAFSNIGNQVDLTKDALGKINEVKYNSIGEALTGIGRNIETGLLIPMGEKALPLFQQTSDWIVANMPTIKETVSDAFEIAGGAVQAFGDGIDRAKKNSEWLIPVIAGLVAAITSMTIIGTINNLMVTWKASTIAQTIAQGGLNAVLIANPIGLVVTAIGLLVSAGVSLYMNWDTVKAKAEALWMKMRDVFGNIKKFVLGVWNDMVSGIKGAVNVILSALNKMITAMNRISFSIPDWVPEIGGKSFGFNIPTIPMLAAGGNIIKGGAALVGENGPEILNLPTGASVTPLGKTGITFERGAFEGAMIMDDYGVDRMMDRVVERLALLGVR